MASLSYTSLEDDRYKVRWREWAVVDGERKRIDRAQTVVGAVARDELMVRVRHALDTVGFYEPEARPEERSCNLEQAALKWHRFKTSRGIAPATSKKHLETLHAFFKAVRELKGIAADEVVPGQVMSCDLLAEVRLLWKERGLIDRTLYDRSTVVYEMWRWVSDDPETWPNVKRAPLTSDLALPLVPARGSAPEAPTWAECDAICRRAREYVRGSGRGTDLDLRVAFMRYTGLRISQVQGVCHGDIDVQRCTLRVREGKSRQEKAEQRVIPVSPHLLDLLQPRLEESHEAEEWLFPRGPDGKKRVTRPDHQVVQFWRDATEAGEVRREAWDPPGRHANRPNHAFRAAFMAHVVAEAEVKDYLVGHAATNTRSRHYARPSDEALRRAVDSIPPIEWTPPTDADNVVPLRRRKA